MSIPGWYPDPQDHTKVRWWDGAAWSGHVEDAAPATTPYGAHAPIPPQASYPVYTAEPLTAPADTPWKSPWVWLVIALPVLPLVGLVFIDWASMVDYSSMLNGSDPLGLSMYSWMFSPAYLLTVVGGWAAYGLSVLFAYFDWRTLRDNGIPRPFHWAWTFLYGAVYVIGRSVVFRKRTGNRSAMTPMWVQIVVMVLEFVALIAFMIWLFVTITEGVFDTLTMLDSIST